MRRLYFIMFFVCIYIQAMGQIAIDTCSYAYYDEFKGTKVFVKSYKITNNSLEDYVTWISSREVDSLSNKLSIRLYFIKRHSDFSLMDLIFENIFNSSMTNNIGSSFLKKIKPHEMFEYLIIKKNADSDFFEKRICVVPYKEVEDFLLHKIPDDCFSTITTLPLCDN